VRRDHSRRSQNRTCVKDPGRVGVWYLVDLEGMCIATSQTPKPRWKAIGLRSYGSRSYEPGTLPAGLAPKVHRRIKDRGLERYETLDSRNCETPNPDNSFPVGKLYTVHGEAVKEGRKDLWIGYSTGIPAGNLRSRFGSTKEGILRTIL
jgi:hypothetical protein